MYRRPILSSQAPNAFLLVRAIALALAILSVGCGGAPIQAESSSPIAPPLLPERMEDSRSAVSFLGTLNAGHLRGAYSLDAVEYAIRRFEPDAILVELPPAAFDQAVSESDRFGGNVSNPSLLQSSWLVNLPELYEVVLPLRHELGYDVVPVSGWTIDAIEDQNDFYSAHPHGPMERWYVLSNAALQAAMLENNGASDAFWLHGREFLELITAASRWMAYYSEEEMGDAGELRLHARHASYMDAALDERRGQRVLVVFAVTSRWYLEPFLRARDDFRFESVSRYLPGN